MTDGVRRLTHEEAEMLISARMDEQLDRADSRALLVHLQGCESCRAFAVQSEVLGRELAALPVLPASAIVDRQIRETIAQGNKRWSIGGLFPATGGNGGLRTALGALAVLTLVSVFLLVRMAGDSDGSGSSIDAPNGGVAQQLDSTATSELAMAAQSTSSGPTETPRVVSQPTQQAGNNPTVAPTQPGSEPITRAGAPTESAAGGSAPPTATLDSAYVYTIDKTKTPTTGGGSGETPTEAAAQPTQSDGNVAVAAIGGELGTPAASTEVAGQEPPAEATQAPSTPAPQENPTEPAGDTSTPEEDQGAVEASVTPTEPTEETATATPPEPTPTPTMTETPVEISVDATDEPATQPPASESNSQPAGDVSPEATATPAAPAPAPTETQPENSPTSDSGGSDSPEPTKVPEGPFTQPTIAPVSGQSATQQDGSDHPGSNGIQNTGPSENQNDGGSTGDDNSPPIVLNDGSDVEAAAATGADESTSPQIISTDATTVPGGSGSGGSTSEQGSENGVGGETQPPEPSAIPTVDESAEPSGLDLSDTVADLPSGSSSPLGRLEFSPGMDLYAVFAPDGQLAVADLNGELVVTLGPGDLPVWSGNDLMFSAPGDNGTVVGIWDSDSGDLSYVPASEDEASSDLPIGGDGSSFYYLRTFPDRPGAMEIRSAASDGSDQGSIWSSDSATLGGARPAWSENGILLPTDASWLLIGTDGSESELSANPNGFVGAPVLSPGGGLMAYSAGDQVVVAWTETPGEAVATAPFSGGSGGYAFSTSGEQIVISDGSALHVVSYEGDDLGTLGGNQPIGGVYWVSDTIYYLQIGENAALRSTSLDTIQSP